MISRQEAISQELVTLLRWCGRTLRSWGWQEPKVLMQACLLWPDTVQREITWAPLMETSFQRLGVSRHDLGPVYMEKTWPGLNSHSPSTRAIVATLGEPLNILFTRETKGWLCQWVTRIIYSNKHFGSPSRVNSVKARQSENARVLLSKT